ncbi:MAG: ATP-binding protein [Candidatus Gastranaerophilales bacterium]|nr:ATP-binding protein [Candidatus Gastranaerophilales bacterium]
MSNKISLTTQNKLILLGLVSSTLLIILIAVLAIFNIQSKLNEGYQNFGKIISKTLATESTDLIKDIPEEAKYDKLKYHSQSILNSNDDIAFIEFTDNKGNIIYSSKDDYTRQAQGSKIAVSSPMIVKKLGKSYSIGSVMVGLSGNIINQISGTTRASLLFVFVVAWAVFALVILINTYLITRELRILHHGVRKISTGEFGYTIQGKGVSSEVRELFDAFNDMSNRLHLYEEQNVEQLTLEKNKLEAVLMSIANGVVVCDNFDNVVLVNNQAQKLLEVSDNEILNTKIQLYCDSNGELCFKEKIEQFKDTPLDIMETKPLDFNIEVDKRVIKAVISPMFSRNKDYVGYIIVLIDVTKETEMDKIRSNFISNVSHELRTPVTVLRSYIDTLFNFGNDFDFNTQKEFIGVMNEEIIRLNRLVNDVLDFSRLEANIKLEKKSTNVVSVIENCVNSMQVLAQERNLTFSIMKEPELPDVILNEGSIERALKNILSNSIKYSPDGGRIKIRAERARMGEFVEVSVEDQGSGIPEEYQSKIFDRFFRIENDTHTVKGTGLGLHLVKISVEKHHGGQVFVQSKVNEGSTFGFRLPINPPKEEDVPEENYNHFSNEQQEQETPQEPDYDWEVSLEKREV